MARTSTSDVKDLTGTTLDDPIVSNFVDDANVYVDEHLTDEGLSSAILEKIEKYLAAHFLSMLDRRTSEEDVGDTSFTFEGDSGMGLKATTYGQQAIAYDTTGTLQKLSEGQNNVSFDAIGVDID